ncbi:MAG: radical SAM protein [Deltaproteobacteria bacterium]|nr:radical SAM protein [Deltaproteobacteria bacterium]MBW1718850.1 radical SAM protein [Deltaproteobacteria bacterium]MBW1965256.1 radical SAM protein [Deltaproteobacteria bacterium]MBW2080739.1 radical SAM protein [Deltaproteobacteria bacterium]MBW2351101.1 radical SAM protein [Deltaproteobacteria bacterium]
MYKYLFGPVPSRRLGMSLGIDLIPHKICSLNCIYCECGPTTKLTLERKEYVPYDDVVKELDNYFSNNPNPDYITFSGSGEPTLNSRIGDVLEFIKLKKPDIPVAVLTNGTLFYQKQLRAELFNADLVLPSLDAASEMSFRRINRPHHSLNIQEYIQGLQDFRKEYKGQIWLEVLIIPGYNDSNSDLKLLKQAFDKIQPEIIQLNTLDRPGAVSDIRTATRTELQQIVDYWQLDNVEIIASASKRKDIKSYREDIQTAILETIYRRPCTLNDLVKILGSHINEINKYLDILEAENKIESTRQERGLFYKIKHK